MKGFRKIVFHLEKLNKRVEEETEHSDNKEIKKIISNDKIKLPLKPIEGKTTLTVNETALLFKLLKEHSAILNYDNQPLSNILFFLTAHSQNTLRAGLGSIEKNIRDKDVKIYKDIDRVILLLNRIIDDLKSTTK